MKLRKLRVCGFKSFADKTEFDFRDGITVVVGPNGCGKSNVVDAVKWTLGEQSAKSLRGKEMLDVIFNGSVGRKAAAYAETALLFENTAGLLGPDHKFVEVSRRLYRSGESEYLVNKTAARLKDIKELFLNTGVGVDAYSVIEQGKVDILLASNPQERRLIFEEAAGISRFKAKKKEALRKLERVQSNLARLADINEEVDRRLRSLKVQAGKARNYKEYADRLRELRVRWSLAEFHRRGAELAEARARLAEVRTRRTAAAEGAEASEGRRAAAAAGLAELDEALAGLRVAAADGRARVAAVEDRLAAGRRRIAELDEELARDRAALAEGRRRCRDLLRAALDGSDGIAGLEARIRDGQGGLATAQAEAAERRARAGELAAAVEAGKAEVVEWARRLAQVRNESAGIGVHHKNLQANRAKLAERAAALRSEIDSLQAERAKLTESLASLETFIAQQDEARLARRSEAEAVAAQRSDLSGRLEAARREFGKLESRRTVLRELEAQLEGVDAGVRDILRRARSAEAGEAGFGTVRGMVADFLRTSGRYVPIIEAALGRHLQSLVVSRSDRLMSDIGGLPAMSGQARFFCLDRLPVEHDGLRLEGEPEYVGRPLDFVEVGAEARRVVEHLFARTIVVRSVRGAMTLAPKVPRGYRFVTMDGQVVGEDGSLELGGPAGRGGLLQRKSELRELDGQVGELQKQVEGLEAELGDVDGSARELDRLQQDLRTAIYQAATARAEKQARGERLDAALAKAAGEEPGLAAELAGLEDDLAAVGKQVDTLRRAGDELEQARATAEARVAELTAELERGRLEETRQAERIADLRVELSRIEQQRQSFIQNAEQLGAARRQADESLEAARTRIARHRERIAEAERSVLADEAQRADLYVQKDEAEFAARGRSAGRAGLPERLAALTAETRRHSAELGELTETVHRLELACSEADVRVENLCSRVRDEYGADLADEYRKLLAGEPFGLPAPPPTPDPTLALTAGTEGAEAASSAAPEVPAPAPSPAPAEQPEPICSAAPLPPASATWPPFPQSVTTEMLLNMGPTPEQREIARAKAIAELESGDWTAVQNEITELKGKIDRLGNVNLDSIAELAELEQRHGKLQSQVIDLNDARKRLEDLIGRINVESAELFSKTFVEVRKNFQELFRKLFGGGKADVYLEDETNPLECGIDIVARPPGKEPRNISLLSGGEKTMTAVAMLLAVFRSRPSPFCILDEVDAALDEANTHRFGGVLTEFTDHSQFIVISHRKPTMSVADVMYGVTMQETGVSKKVAVRFNDHGEVVATDGEGPEAAISIGGPPDAKH